MSDDQEGLIGIFFIGIISIIFCGFGIVMLAFDSSNGAVLCAIIAVTGNNIIWRVGL